MSLILPYLRMKWRRLPCWTEAEVCFHGINYVNKEVLYLKEVNVKVNHKTSERSYSIITAILVWCGLVVVSSLYITIPLVSVFVGAFKVSTSQAAWTGSAFSFCYAVG